MFKKILDNFKNTTLCVFNFIHIIKTTPSILFEYYYYTTNDEINILNNNTSTNIIHLEYTNKYKKIDDNLEWGWFIEIPES
jgi:hypothetical protein